MNQELRIIVLIIAAFGIGIAVLLTRPDYRISNNLASNRDYYPAITIPSEPTAVESNGSSSDVLIKPTFSEDSDESTLSTPLLDDDLPQQDFEF